MIRYKDQACIDERDEWASTERPLAMAPGFRVPLLEALLWRGYSPSPRHLQHMLILMLCILLSLTRADLGTYSDTEDQKLTITITPLPADSGYPYSLYRQVRLQCDIETEPAIDISKCGWYFNYGKMFLKTNNKYTLYVEPSRGTVHSLTMALTINGITQNELGYYTCEGKNSAGLRKSATVELAIVAEDTVGVKEPQGETTQVSNYFYIYGNQTANTTMDPGPIDTSTGQRTGSDQNFIILIMAFLTLFALL